MKDDMKPYFVGPDTPPEISENVRYVNEMRWQRDALLRVARSIDGLMEIAEIAMPDTYFASDSRVCEAREALKAVEHLLD